jgi:hypothetical protein
MESLIELLRMLSDVDYEFLAFTFFWGKVWLLEKGVKIFGC